MNFAIAMLLSYATFSAAPHAPRQMTACETKNYHQMIACGDVPECVSYVQREVAICSKSR